MDRSAVRVIETELREESPPTVTTTHEESVAADPAAPTQPARRSRLSTNTKTVLAIVLTLGLLALWLVAYARVFSGLEAQSDQRGLHDRFRQELAAATAPVGGVIDPGAPVAMITASGAALENMVVVEGTSSNVMRHGPGHRRDTPLPGQAGSSVLMGRALTFGGPFGQITDLVPGDAITVTTGQGAFDYTVEAVRRPGDPLPIPLGEGESRLTLVTAEGSGLMQGWAAQSPVFVDALLDGKAADTPPGRPTVVATAEGMLANDTVTLVALVLWLQLLLVVVVLWVWARRRWGIWQAWMVAVPVTFGVLWGATSAAFAMLPNLL